MPSLHVMPSVQTSFAPHLSSPNFTTIHGVMSCHVSLKHVTLCHALLYTGSHFNRRISFRIIVSVWRSTLGLTPAYHCDLCCATLDVPGRYSLDSMHVDA